MVVTPNGVNALSRVKVVQEREVVQILLHKMGEINVLDFPKKLVTFEKNVQVILNTKFLSILFTKFYQF